MQPNNLFPIGSKTITIPSSGLICLGSFMVNNNQPANRLDIQASLGNAENVFIGASNVTNDRLNGGMELEPGDFYQLEILTNLNFVYVAGTVGDAVLMNWYIGERS